MTSAGHIELTLKCHAHIYETIDSWGNVKLVYLCNQHGAADGLAPLHVGDEASTGTMIEEFVSHTR